MNWYNDPLGPTFWKVTTHKKNIKKSGYFIHHNVDLPLQQQSEPRVRIMDTTSIVTPPLSPSPAWGPLRA